MKKIKIERQYRKLTIKSGDINKEERTVDVSFSSEEPVERWFGTEILDHKSSSVDLNRLNNGAAVLEDHSGGQIGVVEFAEIKEGRGFAKLRFSQNGQGANVFQDIEDGIRRNISFGYQLNDLTLEKEEKGENPVYRSNSWTPFEISVVGTPADTTIGVGRSSEDSNEIEVDDSFRDLTDKTTTGDNEKDLIKKEKEKETKIEYCKMAEKRLLLAKMGENSFKKQS